MIIQFKYIYFIIYEYIILFIFLIHSLNTKKYYNDNIYKKKKIISFSLIIITQTKANLNIFQRMYLYIKSIKHQDLYGVGL